MFVSFSYLHCFLLLVSFASFIRAEEFDSSLVQQIDESKFRIETITFDQSNKTISFPARIQMTEGNLEYLLVTKRGKTHESLLLTDISPTHLNIALKLLSFKESKQLFSKDNKEEPNLKDSSLEVIVTWKKGDERISFPATDLIQHSSLHTSLPAADWRYTGSTMNDGKFAASLAGDIIAIFTDQVAILNYSGEGRLDDTLWIPYTTRLPETETIVTVTIKPTNQ